MQRMAGKTALITGGNSGIGLAIARLFHDEGAHLVITGRDAASLEAARAGLGDQVLALQSDAGSVPAIEALMADVGQRCGRIDTLVVNAGVALAAPVDHVSEAMFDTMVSVNLKGAFFTIQKALPLMQPGASVIVTTSIANRVGTPMMSVYGATKAGLRSMVQTLALELVGRGIRVNAISPGPITTPIHGRFGLPPEVSDAVKAQISAKSPMQRFGRAEEVAKAALFLASDDASYIVGEEIIIDGGMSQQ